MRSVVATIVGTENDSMMPLGILRDKDWVERRDCGKPKDLHIAV